MTISKDQLENRAYTSDATAFNLRLGGKSHPEQFDCPMDVPPATQVNPDGKELGRTAEFAIDLNANYPHK